MSHSSQGVACRRSSAVFIVPYNSVIGKFEGQDSLRLALGKPSKRPEFTVLSF